MTSEHTTNSQEGPAAVVCRLQSVEPHPNADKLEVVRFSLPTVWRKGEPNAVQCVTGPHYKAHTEGVWFRPGAMLPGWLMEEMWLGKGIKTFEVRSFPIRGELSDGIFAGSVWRKTPDAEFERWRFWKSNWTPGLDVSDYFGVWFPRPLSSAAEQPVSNRRVVVSQGIGTAQAELSATPTAGSNT